MSDPGFTSYVRAARRVLRAGLKLVLNPLHWKFMLQIDQRTLQLFWGAMLREFNTTDFPVDRVAFEMANEPGNWNRWSVENRAMDLLPGFAAQVSAAQPERVLVLPAGEMGWPRCGPDGPAAHFVQSWLAAIDDGALAFRTRFANASNAIATFHYYDPRYFTNQPQGSAREWDLATGRASVASNFDTLRRAFPSNVPLYLGEFGLNVQYVPPQSGADWLFAVRSEAEAHGMPWSLWTYYTSDEGVVTSAVSGDERLVEWDCSSFVAAVYNVTPPDDRSRCGGLLPFSHVDGESDRRVRRRRADDASCDDKRPSDVPDATIFLPDLPKPPCSPAPPPFAESPPPLSPPNPSNGVVASLATTTYASAFTPTVAIADASLADRSRNILRRSFYRRHRTLFAGSRCIGYRCPRATTAEVAPRAPRTNQCFSSRRSSSEPQEAEPAWSEEAC